MASITPRNGRADFILLQNPHTYWELNSTNLGTNFGDDSLGGNNTAIGAGDVSTAESYEGVNGANDPPSSDALDVYIVTDAAFLLYVPSGLSNGTWGIFHNGGGTHAQGVTIRKITGGMEIGVTHNASGTNQDAVVGFIPDADLGGWFTIGAQFAGNGGNQGDMAVWINGVVDQSATRSHQLQYGSGNPDFGRFAGDNILAANVRAPTSYANGNWPGDATLGSGILVANFTADNPNNDNTSPAGKGDSFYTDYHDSHVEASSVDLVSNDVEAASELSSTSLTQVYELSSVDIEAASECDTPTVTPVPRAWLNTSTTKTGATEVDITAFTDGTGTLSDPVGGPTGPLFLGIENTGNGEIGWIAVTVNGGTVNLVSTDLEALSELSQPALVQQHELASSDVESASELSQPAISQTHELSSVDLEAASEVSSPTISGESVLQTADLESQSEVSAPALSQLNDLSSAGIESASEVSSPALSQEHALSSSDVEAASELSTPALTPVTEVYDLTSVDVEATSELSSPSLIHVPRAWLNTSETTVGSNELIVEPVGVADDALSFTDPVGGLTGSLFLGIQSTNSGDIAWVPVTVNSPADHILVSVDVEATAELGTPVLTHVVNFDGESPNAESEVSSPTLTEVSSDTLDAVDVEAASEVSSPGITQVHELSSVDLEATSEVSAPLLQQQHELVSNDIEAGSEVSQPGLVQAQQLSSVDVESASELSVPSLAVNAIELSSRDLEALSQVTQPALTVTYLLDAVDVEAVAELSLPNLVEIPDPDRVSIVLGDISIRPVIDGEVVSVAAVDSDGTGVQPAVSGNVTIN